MAAGFPQRPRWKLQNLLQKFQWTHTVDSLYSIDYINHLWFSVGEEYTRVWLAGGRDYWGLFRETGSPSCDDVICLIHSLSGYVQRHRMMPSFLVFYFEFFIVFYWSIVDLQYCVHFCYTEERVSYTLIHFFFNIFFSIMVYLRIWIQYPILYIVGPCLSIPYVIVCIC